MSDDVTASARTAAAEADPGSDPARSPLLRTLLKLPLKKLAIWGGLLGLLILLSDFFPLILMTFILSYIAAGVVARVEDKFSSRWIPVVLFFLFVVAVVVGFFYLAVPQVFAEVKTVREEASRKQHWNHFLDQKLKASLGEQTYADLNEQIGAPRLDEGSVAEVESSRSLSVGILGHVTPEQKKEALARITAFGLALWKGIVYVFLTIVFSLMLVWGLPDFEKGIQRLEKSRFSDVYGEVAPSLAQFGRLLGRAFEAQMIIAACNTLITFTGMRIIGIPGSFLLSVVVFLCSFIPVAGVFISTTPIALAALLMHEGSFGKVLAVVGMVTVAHIVEAYILNPRIYGHHMRMNPLAVLAILVIAEHTVGVWGLVVAIPFSTYVWRYVILGETEEPQDKKPEEKKPEPAVPAPSGEKTLAQA